MTGREDLDAMQCRVARATAESTPRPGEASDDFRARFDAIDRRMLAEIDAYHERRRARRDRAIVFAICIGVVIVSVMVALS